MTRDVYSLVPNVFEYCPLYLTISRSASLSLNGIIFIKLFDLVNQTLTFLDHYRFNGDDRMNSIFPFLRKRFIVLESDKLQLFEEISWKRVNLVDTNKTFFANKIKNGDVLIVEMTSKEQTSNLISFMNKVIFVENK